MKYLLQYLFTVQQTIFTKRFRKFDSKFNTSVSYGNYSPKSKSPSVSGAQPSTILLTEITIGLRTLTERDSDSEKKFPYDKCKYYRIPQFLFPDLKFLIIQIITNSQVAGSTVDCFSQDSKSVDFSTGDIFKYVFEIVLSYRTFKRASKITFYQFIFGTKIITKIMAWVKILKTFRSFRAFKLISTK